MIQHSKVYGSLHCHPQASQARNRLGSGHSVPRGVLRSYLRRRQVSPEAKPEEDADLVVTKLAAALAALDHDAEDELKFQVLWRPCA